MLREVVGRAGRDARERLLGIVGGPARLRVVALLAAMLGLDGADSGTVSAAASNLEHSLGIGNTEIGLLISIVYIAAACATVPVGMLTDRVKRTRMLAISVGLWGVAMLWAGAAPSYELLLAARAMLGIVTATAGPTVASLIGDYFPASERGRMYGMIVGGELVGTGIGFAFSGEIASFLSWRFAFWWLIIPAAFLVWGLYKLPEPARGGQSRLSFGQRHVPDEEDVSDAAPGGERAREESEEAATGAPQEEAREREITPRYEAMVRTDPTEWSIWKAIRYVFQVRTNAVIIVASALAYFYFAGIRSFALIYVSGHFGIASSVATLLTLVVGLGALAGVFIGGRLADRLLGRGHITARVLIPMVALFAVVAAFAPGVVVTAIGAALPLLIVGAGMLGAAIPPLDAARLDIIHPSLWGRAEGVRTVFRTAAQAIAPTLFGFLSESVFGGGTTGLEYTFLVCLVTLIAAACLAIVALRTYPRDVAALARTPEAVGESPG